MRLYGGRKAIVGYVAPAVHEKIQRVADSRRLAITDLVATATAWLVEYLEAPGATPLPDVSRLGIPPLPTPNASLGAHSGVDLDTNLNAKTVEPIAERPRWKFERLERRAARTKPTTANRKRRTTTKK
jgi:hypothetical protein